MSPNPNTNTTLHDTLHDLKRSPQSETPAVHRRSQGPTTFDRLNLISIQRALPIFLPWRSNLEASVQNPPVLCGLCDPGTNSSLASVSYGLF